MRKKPPVPFLQKFPNADPLALRLLEHLLAFDPKDRPTAEEVRLSILDYFIQPQIKCDPTIMRSIGAWFLADTVVFLLLRLWLTHTSKVWLT